MGHNLMRNRVEADVFKDESNLVALGQLLFYKGLNSHSKCNAGMVRNHFPDPMDNKRIYHKGSKDTKWTKRSFSCRLVPFISRSSPGWGLLERLML